MDADSLLPICTCDCECEEVQKPRNIVKEFVKKEDPSFNNKSHMELIEGLLKDKKLQEEELDALIKENKLYREKLDTLLKENKLNKEERDALSEEYKYQRKELVLLRKNKLHNELNSILQRLCEVREYSLNVFYELEKREENFQRLKSRHKPNGSSVPLNILRSAKKDAEFCSSKMPEFLTTVSQFKSLKEEAKNVCKELGRPFTMDKEFDGEEDAIEIFFALMKSFSLELGSVFPPGEKFIEDLKDRVDFYVVSYESNNVACTRKEGNAQSYLKRMKAPPEVATTSNAVSASGYSVRKTSRALSENANVHQLSKCGTDTKLLSKHRPKVAEDPDKENAQTEPTSSTGSDNASDDTGDNPPMLHGRHVIPECPICNIIFSKKKNFKKHMVSMHNYKM